MKLSELRDYVKEGKVIFGYNQVSKYLKTKKLSFVVIAKNTPKHLRDDVLYLSKLARVEVVETEKTSQELGMLCGKPFPVAVLGIKR